MTVFGICMAKNADDIIGPVIEHMLGQVDHIIVADNLSTDRTREILESYPITVVDDNDPAYNQSAKTTHLAYVAAQMGADWVVPFDSDEWWFSPYGTLNEVIPRSEHNVIAARMYNYFPTALDGDDPDPIKRICWRQAETQDLHKVACATHPSLVIAMGNHHATYFNTRPEYNDTGLILINHFPWRSAEQFVRKGVEGGAAIRLTSLDYDSGRHWRDYANLVDAQGAKALENIYYRDFFQTDPAAAGLVYDPVSP